MPENGLENRYRVERRGDVDGKHDDCRYFVLDPQHDSIARDALSLYAVLADRAGNANLAHDLYAWLRELT